MRTLIFFFVLFVGTCLAIYCDKDDLHCRQIRKLTTLLEDKEKELKRYKRIVDESTCNVCNIGGVNPCQNNGTCVVLPSDGTTQKFACDCPNNYAGDLCQTLVECKNNTCGVDATCTVFNHKTVCACPFGSTGDPNVACNFKTSQACFSGDPHYVTFDGLKYDYMGTCTYYVTKPCDRDDFYVTSRSYIAPANPHVAIADRFTVFTYNQTFYIDQTSSFYFNGIKTNLPFYFPSAFNPIVTVNMVSGKATITIIPLKSTITFVSAQLCVTLPHMEQFYGNDTMCGAFGNIDGDCTDDVVFENGTTVTAPATCTTPPAVTAAQWIDSWIAPDPEPGCVRGGTIAADSTCNLTAYTADCAPINQVLSSTGPFKACLALGNDIINNYYYGCLYDTCEGHSRCDSLATFARTCQERIPFVDLDNWRTELNCPYECQPHSHYTMHASPCQPSCSRAANEVSNNCQDIPEEGCECDIGYYLDPNVDEDRDAQYVCRLIEDCGCTDEFGHYYKPNTTWMNADCTAIFTCKNGQLEEQVVSCSTNGKCVSENGQGTCVCNPGYLGSGHQCKLPPIRHCADLYVKQNIRKSGIYTVNIGATFDNETLYNPGTSISVYCDMEHDGGGWILVGGGRMNYTRSFAEYKAGFSEVLGDRKAFLGLEYLHQATNETDTSLRVIIDRCPEAPAPVLTECTYPSFTVYSEEEDYAVFIPEPCGGGNETGQYADPWVRWDPTKIGPGFATYDRDNHLNCSAANIGTGWWFDNSGTIGCGYANLNGQRLGCDAGSQVGYNGIFWDGKPIDDAVMYIRPRSFPNL